MLALGGAAGVGLMGALLAGRTGTRIDVALERAMRMRRGPVRRVAQALVHLGDPPSIAVAVSVAAVAARRRDRAPGERGAPLVLVAPVLAGAVGDGVLKPVVGRRRCGSLAFPSGHTAAVTGLGAALALVARRERPGSAVAVAPLVGAVAVAIAVVGRGYHYPSDVVGGLALGCSAALGTAWALDGRQPRRAASFPSTAR